MNGNYDRDMIQSKYGKTKEETQKWNKKTLCEYTISELPLSSVSKRASLRNHSNENMFQRAKQTRSQMKLDFPDD